jgi:hypothetical protein
MSLFSDIKAILAVLKPDMVVRMHNAFRHEEAALNYSGAVCRFHEDVTASDVKTGSQTITTATYTIDFLDADEWDNSENSNDCAQYDENTFEIIQRMIIIANTVFLRLGVDENNSFHNFTEVRRNYEHLARINNATMSGVRYTYTVSYTAPFTCENETLPT